MNKISRSTGIVRFLFLFTFLPAVTIPSFAQTSNPADSAQFLTLRQCIDYAMQHQPGINRSYINVSIAKATNAINLSGWYPQVSINANLTHYLQLPTSFFADTTNGGV
jgi:outer membrane protein TolC